MHFLNSIMLISCDMWPLLFLSLGALMWLLGWFFGRSRVSKLREELDSLTRRNKKLVSEYEKSENNLKLVKNDYDRANKTLARAKNDLEENNSKLNHALSKTRMIETEKQNLLTERDQLFSEKNALITERDELKSNSFDAADANVSNNAIADLKEKLAESERALAACEASKIKEDKVSFVAPPPIVPPIDKEEDTSLSDNLNENASQDFEDKSEEMNLSTDHSIEDSLNIDSSSDTNSSEINQFVAGGLGSSERNDFAAPSDTASGGESADGGESAMGRYFKNDNLQIIEGVGPKIESILKGGGFDSWADLANASDADLQKVLDDAGPRYRMHNPSAWSDQARFANNGQWDKLVQYQKDIDGNSSDASSKAEKLYFKALGFAAAKPEDLKVVEGIGPKIESLLKNAGIKNWTELASTEVSRIQDILTSAGDRYRLADPGTWPKQAELAAAQKWTELKEYQDFLSGGKA